MSRYRNVGDWSKVVTPLKDNDLHKLSIKKAEWKREGTNLHPFFDE